MSDESTRTGAIPTSGDSSDDAETRRTTPRASSGARLPRRRTPRGRPTWTGSVRWADAASPEAWLPGGIAAHRKEQEERETAEVALEPEVTAEAAETAASIDPSTPEGDATTEGTGTSGAGAGIVADGATTSNPAETADGCSDDDHSDADLPDDDPGAADDEAEETSDRSDLDELSDFARSLADDPRTGALPLVDVQAAVTQRESRATDETVYELRSAAQRLEEVLIGGKRVLTRKEVAQLAEVSTASARKLWRALGQPLIPEGEEAFTVSDAAPLRRIADLVSSGLVDEETALQMSRAIGQMTDRLVVWQMEAMVEYLTEAKGLSDSEARRASLDVFEDLIEPLQEVMVYAWRRNLAGALSRLNVNVEETLGIGGTFRGQDPTLPLARGIGFIDLVSYTRLSQQLDSRELGRLVKHFQFLAYNIVAAGGGKVIKTVGDEVFFAAETPLAGAEIAMTLLEQVRADQYLPKCRVGYSWGRVLSRMGDIFGTTVNLAARLTAIAEPTTVVTDTDTARILERDDAFRFDNLKTVNLHGLGEVGVVEMHRASDSAPRISTEDIT